MSFPASGCVINFAWVLISKEALRQSQDEEIIADLVAWVVRGKSIRSSSSILDQLYGFKESNDEEDESTLSSEIELQIQKINEEVIKSNIQFVLDEIIRILNKSSKTFNTLLFNKNQQPRISRYFQIVFLAFYSLIIDDGLEIINSKKIVEKLKNAGNNIIQLSSGGGIWSAKEKQTQRDALYGVIKECFGESQSKDPSRHFWITRFENILMQSSTEQTLYDFKVGLCELSESLKQINKSTFSKIIKTLTAMANTLPTCSGYCILGVADNLNSAQKYEEIYNIKSIQYSNFYITGIDKEAEKTYKSIDKYFNQLIHLIKEEPISERDRDNIPLLSLSVNTDNF